MIFDQNNSNEAYIAALKIKLAQRAKDNLENKFEQTKSSSDEHGGNESPEIAARALR